MAKSKCNCKGCNNKAVELNKVVTRDTSGHRGVYSICDECLGKINKILDGVSTSIEVKTKKVTEVAVKEKKATKETEVSVKKKKAPQAIREYGIDRLTDEYVNKGRSAKDIAEELGVSAAALNQQINRLGIRKRGANKEESTSSDSKEGN